MADRCELQRQKLKLTRYCAKDRTRVDDVAWALHGPEIRDISAQASVHILSARGRPRGHWPRMCGWTGHRSSQPSTPAYSTASSVALGPGSSAWGGLVSSGWTNSHYLARSSGFSANYQAPARPAGGLWGFHWRSSHGIVKVALTGCSSKRRRARFLPALGVAVLLRQPWCELGKGDQRRLRRQRSCLQSPPWKLGTH
jgi:hypothetical protein